MAADANKLISKAEKYLEKGKPELALAEFRAAIDLQPNSEALLQRTADLALSLGKLGPATELLRRLFAMAIDGKQVANAGLVFRRLQRIKALEPDVVCRYADLCQATNRKEAADAYRISFQEYQRLGEPKRALDCLTEVVRLDPKLEDFREQARVAEALREPSVAAGALVSIGIMQEQAGQDSSEAYARAYALDASNMAARLGHGRAMNAQKRYAEAIELLRPLATYPSAPQEARDPYCAALLATGRIEEAEPFVWSLFERNPAANKLVMNSVIGGLLDRERVDKALRLARRLEEFSRKNGRRSEFMFDMAMVSAKSKPSIEFLEYLAELYNSANRETDYSQILARLFDLYYKAGNYAKALDALDRAVDIDSYEAAHKERLQKLLGHAPEQRLQALAKRLGVEAPNQAAVAATESSAAERAVPEGLDDLVVQAEIFLQYGMRDKAMEKIEGIQRMLSNGTQPDSRVRQLFASAGLPVPGHFEEHEPVSDRGRAAEDMARAAEVSRLIARQNDPRQVMVTAVNQIGARWQYSRCLAALAAAGKPPSLVVEYCSPEMAKSERAAMVRLLAFAQRLVAADPVFHAPDVQLASQLAPVRGELEKLNVKSLAVFALMEEDKPIGLLILQQCGAKRRWSPDDLTLLRSLADQVALAVHGARLRSLVSTLGVAEQETGLLKRSSYLDAVMAELGRRRGSAESSSRTLALLQVCSLTSESAVEAAVTELVRSLRALAQDSAMLFRYDRDTVALLLPYMGAVEAAEMVRRVRDALEPLGILLTAGIAQVGPVYGVDPEDSTTEWINRVARALNTATSSPDKLCALPPMAAIA